MSEGSGTLYNKNWLRNPVRSVLGIAVEKVNISGNDLGRGSADNASLFSCIGSVVFPELTCSLLLSEKGI